MIEKKGFDVANKVIIDFGTVPLLAGLPLFRNINSLILRVSLGGRENGCRGGENEWRYLRSQQTSILWQDGSEVTGGKLLPPGPIFIVCPYETKIKHNHQSLLLISPKQEPSKGWLVCRQLV